jgi:hypothetical protein
MRRSDEIFSITSSAIVAEKPEIQSAAISLHFG